MAQTPNNQTNNKIGHNLGDMTVTDRRTVCQRPHTTVNWCRAALTNSWGQFFSRLLRTHRSDSWKLKFQGTESISQSESGREPRTSVSVSVRPGDLGPNTNKQAEPPGEAQTVPLSLAESEHPELIHEHQGVEGTTAQRSSCGNRF